MARRGVVRLSQRKVPGVLAVGGATAGRGGAGVVPNFRWVPVSSNQFQFEKIMRRRNQNAACLTGWAVSVGSASGLAGESGVAAPALPPQSKTRWLQPVLPWAGDTMRRGVATANSLRFDELRWVPVSSNQFQTIPITFWGKL